MRQSQTIRRFRALLWELIEATEVHNRARPTREHKLAYAQWSMLNDRFDATFGPNAEFPRPAATVAARP